MTMQRQNFDSATGLYKVWKSAQLLIGFHRDRKGRARDKAKVWSPSNGRARLHADPEQQETFIQVEAESGQSDQDVQIKLRQDQIALRRDGDIGWQGIVLSEHTVAVRTADGAWIKIDADGSVTRQTEFDETTIEADGSVTKRTEYTDAFMSPDGVELARNTPDNVAMITALGVVCKPHNR
ncbi:hypothetical protein [Ruegeria sp. HKCCD8929]|uniref:hypothetical protein n=1 Tax=Ruegeria sp. HKCCD8929 TaxID=2683006 RepID=UPI001489F755|nr:hypothetical protein [Ruegeria sp. HKCCD8929]